MAFLSYTLFLQSNSLQSDRPKRVYIKSGAYRSSKRSSKTKSDALKQKVIEQQQRKVGRPKGGISGNKRKNSAFKKRGRRSGYFKHINSGDENRAEDNDGGEAEVEEELEELEGVEGEDRDAGVSGEEIGGATETLSVAPAANGLSRPRASAKRHQKSYKSLLSLSERDFCK